ncbi:MAG: hypothetical protein L3J42_02440 [Hydrogenimonas sp.]|nr:hypothetical protein [Hydrogenimonas sp.]
MKYFNHISTIAGTMLVGSLIFSGCGGGGDTTSSATTASVAITGKAVDELILNGVVEVHKESAAGEVIGSGRTSSTDGTYTINLGGYRGVAVVSVTCDADSTLYFPATNTTESCPTSTQLYSAADVTETDSDSVTVNVAPATHVMYMMATQGNPNATLTPDKLNEARTAAAQIFGTDPIGSDPTEGLYAKVIQAFHDAADDENKTIQELVEEIAEDAADGELGDDTNATYILAQNMQENNVTTPFVVVVNNNTTYVPDDTASLDDVTAAKAFFQSIRTQGNDLLKDGGLFDSEARAIESLIENVTLNGDLAAIILGKTADAIGFGIENNLTSVVRNLVTLQSGDSRDLNITREDINASIWNYTITDTLSGTASEVANGTITLPATDPANDINVSSFTTLSFVFDGTLPATTLDEETQSIQRFQANATMTKTADGAHLEVGDINLSASDGTMVGIKGFKADAGYDYNASNQNDPLTLNYVKLNEITLNGALDQNYSAAGTLGVEYAINSSLEQVGGFSSISYTEVSGQVICIAADTTIPYTGSFTATLPDGNYTIDTDAYGNFYKKLEGVSYDYNAFSQAIVTYNSSCSNGGQPSLYLYYAGYEEEMVTGNSGYIPNKMSFNGNLKNLQSGTEFDGLIAVELPNIADINMTDLFKDQSDEDPHAILTLSGTLKRSGLNDMSLNLTSEFNPDTNITTASLGYVYGATTVNTNGHYNRASKDGNVTITSGDGFAITIVFNRNGIDYGATTPLTKDGKVVGNLDNETGIDRIKYIDGSFESLP